MSPDPTPLTTPPAQTRPVITGGLTLLMAVLGGVAVGNLYWAQPLGDNLHGGRDERRLS